ncbi:MAG: hypothetical protein P8Y81_10295 [Ignavibacteriaceae bacterium]
MSDKNYIYITAILFFCLFDMNVFPQTFGFGCLGFTGGFGGVVYESYKADGLNAYLESLEQPPEDFNYSIGYRVGINFFRASWESGFILTAKGYYQSLSKSKKSSDMLADGSSNDLDLDLKNWGVGIDIGYAITNYFSWKIIDGAVHFNNVMLTNTVNSPGSTIVSKFKSDAGVLGYSVGTVIILGIVKDYISIEGLAGYTNIKIEKLKSDDGHYFSENLPAADVNKNFIESGGFTAVVQLNIGFPL